MANFHVTGLPSSLMFAGLGLPPVPTDSRYKAIISPTDQKSVVGSIITLNGTASTSPNPQPLVFFWAFSMVPIGSQVEKHLFTSNEIDDSIVSFSPDVPGFYRIELIIGDSNFISPPTYAEVYIVIQVVPQNQGLVPDDRANDLWTALGDFWNLYSDKDRFTTIWSSFIQVVASNLLDSYQVDYNKSIKDIQDFFQKKWIKFPTKLNIDPSSNFIIAEEQSGLHASTSLLNMITQPDYANVITVPQTDAILSKTSYSKMIKIGKLITVNDMSYPIIRAAETSTFSQAFIDSSIRTGRTNLPWRTASTIILTEDVESLGVSLNDNIYFSISRIGTNLKSLITAKIIGVNKNRISFVFGKGTIVNGSISSGFSNDEIIEVFKDLNITGIVKQLDGSLTYTGDSNIINQIINSIAFKRIYFEELLSSSSIFTIGKFSFSIKPEYIIRNSKISVSNKIEHIPTLQEYIKQPVLSSSGSTLSRIFGDFIVSLSRPPIFMFENIDFSITNNSVVNLFCNITKASSIVVLPYSDLLDIKIQEGDLLIVEQGLNKNNYYIRNVLDQERVDVFPIPQLTQNNVKCHINRRVKGKFIQFAPNVFSDTNPAPIALWSEVTYIDNSPAIEDNFGSMVGLSKEQYDRQVITAPYKSAVAGLMYAYSRGPTIYDLKLGAQILLGLPFTYHTGIIREIDPEYKLDDNFAPLIGRILIDEVSTRGVRTGLTDIYFYPRGAQKFNVVTNRWEDQDPDFSGLAINLKTGLTFREGDFVDQFAILSKGVEILDYLSDPKWFNSTIGQADFIANIQKYHKAYLRANADLYGSADLDFVSSFIRKTKPHYVDLLPIALKSFADDVIIKDFLFFKPRFKFYDAFGLSLPTATKFDGYSFTPEYFTFEGDMYTRYIWGEDLQTTQGTTTVVSPLGGFVTTRANESHDTPYILVGDLLVINNNLNKGSYLIQNVINNTSVSLDTTATFETLNDQTFAIYRKIQNPIFKGNVTVTGGLSTITLTAGPLSAGVAVGDILIFYDNTFCSKKYTLATTNPLAVNKNISEISGTYSCSIFRPGLITNPIVPTIPMHTFAGNPVVLFDPINIDRLGLIEIGDTIHTSNSIYEVFDFDETARTAYVTPTPISNGLEDVYITRDIVPSSKLATDISDLFILDPLNLVLKDLTYTAAVISGSPNVTLASGSDSPIFLNIKPGDLFKLFTGADASIDLGYGEGCIPIAEVTSTSLTLTRNVIATQNTATYGYKIVKK